MNDNHDNLKTLHTSLLEEGYELPDYEQFEQDMQQGENLQTLYTNLRKEGYELPESFQTFETDMGFGRAVNIEPGSTAAVTSAPVAKNVRNSIAPQQATLVPNAYKGVPVAPQQGQQKQKEHVGMPGSTGVGMTPWTNVPQAGAAQPVPRPKSTTKGAETLVENPYDYSGESQKKLNKKVAREEVEEGLPSVYAPEVKEKVAEEYSQELGTAADWNRRVEEAEQARKEQVSDQVDKMLGDVDSMREERLREMRDEYEEQRGRRSIFDVFNVAGTPGTVRSTAANPAQDAAMNDDQLGMMTAAERKLKGVQNTIEEAKKHAKDPNWFKEFGRGMGAGLSDISTWDFGITDLADANKIQKALEKYDRISQVEAAGGKSDETMTPAEQALLDALATEVIVNEYYGSDVSNSYQAGQSTAVSIPFMASMIVSPAMAAGRGASAAMARYITKRFAGQAAKKGLQKAASKVAEGALKASSRLTIDAGAAAMHTAMFDQGRIAADTKDRMIGQIMPTYGSDGDVRYGGHMGGDSEKEARRKAALDAFIQNESEMLGDYIPGAKAIFGNAKWVKRFMDNPIVKEVARMERRAQFHGFLPEMLEELAGGVMNAAWVGDQTLDDDPETGVFSKDNLATTAISIGATTIAMGCAKLGGYGVSRAQLSSADKNASRLFGDEWEDIRTRLQSQDIGEATAAAEEISRSDEYNEEQKKAVVKYATLYAGVTAYEHMENGGDEDLDAKNANDTYRSAYDDATGAEVRQDISIMARESRERVRETLGEEILQMLEEEDPLTVKQTIEETQQLTDEQARSLADYVAAHSAMSGVRDRIEDDADAMAAGLREQGRQMQHKDGSIRRATLKELGEDGKGKEVFIVDGNVVMTEDGTMVDREASDNNVVVYDPATGERRMISPSSDMGIASLGEVTSVEDYDAEIENKRQQYIQQQLDEAEGTVHVAEGDEVTLPDGRNGVVSPVSEDGETFIVNPADGSDAVVMTRSEYQQMADAAAMESYRQRHPEQMQSQEQEPEAEPQQETEPDQEAVAEEAANTIDREGYVEGTPEVLENGLEVMLQDEDGFAKPATVMGRVRYEGGEYVADENGGIVEYLTDGEVKHDWLGSMMERVEGYRPTAAETPAVEPQQDATEEIPESVTEQPTEQSEAEEAVEQTQAQKTYAEISQKYGEQGAMAKIDASSKVKSKRVVDTKKQLDKAVEKLNNTEYGSKEEAKAESEVEKAQQAYDAAVADKEQWDEVVRERDRALLAKAEAEEAERKAEKERRRAAETQAAREARERYEAEMARRRAEAEEYERRRQEENARKRSGEYVSPIQINPNVEIEGGTKTSRSQMDIAREELADDSMAMEILNDTEPRTLEERASMLLRRGKNAIMLNKEDFYNQTGYSREDTKRYSFMLSNDGMTLEHFAEMLLDEARADHIPFDENDANVGLNAVLNLMGSVNTQGDISNYIANNRVEQAYDYHNRAMAYADSEMSEALGVTSAEYESWKEMMKERAAAAEKMSKEEYDKIFGPYETLIEDNEKPQDHDRRTKEESGTDVREDGRGTAESDEVAGAQGAGAQDAGTPRGQAGDTVSVQSDDTGRVGEDGGARRGETRDDEAEGWPLETEKAEHNGETERDNTEQWASRGGLREQPAGEAPRGSDGVDIMVLGAQLPAERLGDYEKGSRAEQKEVGHQIIDNAKKSGAFIDRSIHKDFGERVKGVSGESVVYIDEANNRVIKVKDPYAKTNLKGHAASDALYEHIVHNLLFPNTQYRLIGISDDAIGDVRFVLEQDYMAKGFTPATQADIDQYLTKELGLTKVEKPYLHYENDYYSITDVDAGGDNVIIDEDGAVCFIDPIIKFKKPAQDVINYLTTGNAIAAARAEVDTNPTEGQKKAGNYKKGHVKVDGYDITIENPKGSVRSGVDPDGKAWEQEMHNDYGYILGTVGFDKDHLDIFLSDDPTQGEVYVVDQVKEDGTFDEHKVMYGFPDAESARQAYLSNYEEGWQGLGAITPVSKEEFKKWIESSKRKTKPFSEYRSVETLGDVQVENGVKGDYGGPVQVSAVEQMAIGGAMVDQLRGMGMEVNTDIAEMRRVRKQAEQDNSEAGKMRHYRTPAGKIYGFSYRGKVYLDPRRIDAELPIHEYAHPWCEAFRKLNPEGWAEVVRTMQADAETWELVQRMNPDLKEADEIAEEMIALGSGQRGRERAEAEYRKMRAGGNFGNVWKNIVKAIQDFWKQVGDFLNIKYESAEQVYDQVVRDFAAKVNPRARVEEYLKEREAEYEQAVESGDVARATAVFNAALREEVGNGMTPFVAVGKYNEVRKLAKKIKTRDPQVVEQVAEMMAGLIPENAVLVPVPSHSGVATDMLDLAEAIAKRTGSDVADVLTSAPRASQYQAKKESGRPLTAADMGLAMIGRLPEGKIPVVIDNVVDSGNTAEACVQALGGGIVVSLGDSVEPYSHAATLKSAAPVLRDRNGKLVPLSKRFDKRKADIRYQKAEEQDIEAVNQRFNEELGRLTEDNADKVVLSLGRPSPVLLSAGIEDKPMRLYGNKLLSKMRKHGYTAEDVRDLPKALEHPIAVFSGSAAGSHAILTEMEIGNNKVLVSLTVGKGRNDVDFNVISSVYGKSKDSVVGWINSGRLLYADKNRALQYLYSSAPIAGTASNEELDSVAKIINNFENPQINLQNAENSALMREGDRRESSGARTYDEALKTSRLAGYSKRQFEEMVERQERRARQRVADTIEKLNLSDRVAVVDTIDEVEGLTDRQREERRDKKGWYNSRTGKIVIILDNHRSVDDIMKTILHEGVAHHGLRALFGSHFDTFLDNVYENAEYGVRQRIVELAKKHRWDIRTATEEYLAGLAEDTNFDIDNTTFAGWWTEIKKLFFEMLHKLGVEVQNLAVTIGDNELRYLLWRSYQNLVNPGRYRSLVEEAEDVAMQDKLKVGRYEEKYGELNSERGGQWYGNMPKVAEGGIDLNEIEKIEAKPESDGYVLGVGVKLTMTDGNTYHLWVQTDTDDGQRGVTEFYGNDDEGVPDEEMTQRFGRFFGHDVNEIFGTEIGSLLLSPRTQRSGITLHREEISKYKQPVEVSGRMHRNGTQNAAESVESVIARMRRENPNTIFLIDTGDHYEARGEDAKRMSEVMGVEPKGDVVSIPRGDMEKYMMRAIRAGLRVATAAEQTDTPVEAEDEVLFREGDGSKERYEKMVSESKFQFGEAMHDNMLSLKKLYEAVLDKGDFRIEDVAGWRNAYIAANAMSSANTAQISSYDQDYMKPLRAEIRRLSKEGGRYSKEERERLTDYMMAKHGLERNVVMAERDAQAEYKKMQGQAGVSFDDLLDKHRQRDYAGLTALTGESDVAAAEAKARQMVVDYEATHDTDELWKLTNAATKRSLYRLAESGLISPEQYDEIRDMYEYYIPLQGFDEKTAEDMYEYMNTYHGSGSGIPLKKAEGRKSKADDPIATIQMNGEAAIRAANRNEMKKTFLHFVETHPSDVVSVSDVWLKKNDVTGEWETYFDAGLKDDDTPAEVERKVNAFEQHMEQLAASDPDHYKRGSEMPNVPYRVVERADASQHQVKVKRGGRMYVLTINGNPRAAQALNGLTNPEVHTEGAFGKVMNVGQSVNRTLSQLYTTRNPEFVISNYLRDCIYANTMVHVKEGGNYAWAFHKNYVKTNPITTARMFAMWNNGELRRKVESGTASTMEQHFYDFINNGGETGWTVIKDIDRQKKDLERRLRGGDVWSAIGQSFDLMNRSVENNARFAAYVTSREMGRSVERSVYDAKEVSVNFNKKGAGDKFLNANGQTAAGKAASVVSGLGRGSFAFWNASVQGLVNIGRAAKRNPWKAAAGFGSMVALGTAMPLLTEFVCSLFSGGGDDDDENAYYNLPEYVRRSNVCFRITRDMPWITIPLPIEYRALYGLGELGTGVLTGKERYSDIELTKQIVSQVSQVLPLDFMEGGGGWHAIVPTPLKPAVEAYANESWTGLPIYRENAFNEGDPEWSKAYANTDKTLIAATRWLNDKTVDPERKKIAQDATDRIAGGIDFNPARIEYMMKGYMGGYFTMFDRVKKSVETMTGDREFEWRNVPIASRVVKTGDERTEMRKMKEEYWNVRKEAEETKKDVKAGEKAQGAIDKAKHIAFMNDSPRYGHYIIYEGYRLQLNRLYDAMKEADGEKKKVLEEEYYAMVRRMLDDIHKYDEERGE